MFIETPVSTQVEQINQITFRFSDSPIMMDISRNCEDKYLKFDFHKATQSWIVKANYLVAEKLIAVIDQYSMDISEDARLALNDIIDRKVKGRIYLKMMPDKTNHFVFDFVPKKKTFKSWFITKINATWDGREYSCAATRENAKHILKWLGKDKNIFVLTEHAKEQLTMLTQDIRWR